MTPVNSTGSISISSCLNCDKVFSLADELIKSMQDFEVFTLEMQFDPKSAKLKSREVLSKFWQLISTVKSFKSGGKDLIENGKELCQSSNPKSTFVLNVEKHRKGIVNDEIEKNESVKTKPKSDSVDKKGKMRSRQLPKPNPNPYMTSKRMNEIKRARTLLRTIKCETGEGFYNLFECLKCQRQFSQQGHALIHVQNVHLNLGAPCPTCSKKFFTKKSLELHISKCGKRQLKKIKVWLKNDSKKPLKVPLHPHEKTKQKQAPSTWDPNRKRNVNSGRKTGGQGAEKSRKIFNPLKIQVRNPFPNFSLKKALKVKVVIERLKMEKTGEISSSSQVRTGEEVETEPQNNKTTLFT